MLCSKLLRHPETELRAASIRALQETVPILDLGACTALLSVACQLALDARPCRSNAPEQIEYSCEELSLALRSIATILLHSPTLLKEIPQQTWDLIQTQAGAAATRRQSPQQAMCAAMCRWRAEETEISDLGPTTKESLKAISDVVSTARLSLPPPPVP
jgi:hypothetical protein